MPPNTTCRHETPVPPEGVLPCGCTTDVVEKLFAEAGVASRPGRSSLWGVVKDHLAPHVGPLEGVLHDAEEGRVWADVLVHGPSDERPSIDLVTAGMSSKPMHPPSRLRRRGSPRRAELMLRLPPEWATTRLVTETLMSRRGNWALLWLQLIARVPHELRGYLGDVEGLELRSRAVPLYPMPGCPFEAVIVADPRRFGRPVPPLRSGGPTGPLRGDAVRFLSLVPLFQREFDFALAKGAKALFSALAAAGVDDLVRCDRGPVV